MTNIKFSSGLLSKLKGSDGQVSSGGTTQVPFEEGKIIFAVKDGVASTEGRIFYDYKDGNTNRRILMSSQDLENLNINGRNYNGTTGLTVGDTIYIIQGNTTGTNGTWTGSDKRIVDYEDGMTILYTIGINGASTTTLNINNLGAVTCYINKTGSKLTTHYPVGAPILLTYHETRDSNNNITNRWWITSDYNTNDNTFTSAYSSTAAGTAAKAATMTGYKIKTNSYTHITFVNANTVTSNVTLNINNQGAKPLEVDNQFNSATQVRTDSFDAGSYILFYDGSKYHMRTDGVLPGKIIKAVQDEDGNNIKDTYISGASVDGYSLKFTTGANASKVINPNFAGSISNGGPAISANKLNGASSNTVAISDQGSGTLTYYHSIPQTTAGIMPNTNNANGILQLNKHNGNYNSQLGFSSNGNLYYRNFNNAAANSTTAWKQIAFTDGTIANANSATKATNDGSNQKITSTYVSSVKLKTNSDTDLIYVNGENRETNIGSFAPVVTVGTGTDKKIPIEYIPRAALERLYIAGASETIDNILSSKKVDAGDTIKYNGKLYYVYEDGTGLHAEVYAAGAAASVEWSNITNKPSTIVGKVALISESDTTNYTTNNPISKNLKIKVTLAYPNGNTDQSFFIPSATTTKAGLLSAAAQTIAGEKTFKDKVYFANGTTYFIDSLGDSKLKSLTTTGNLAVGGNGSINGTLTIGGTTTSKGIVPSAGASYDLGASSKNFLNAFIKKINLSDNGSNPAEYIDKTNYTGNAATSTKLGTARKLTVGNTGKNFDGSANVSWTHAEIGATVSNAWTAGTTEGPTLKTTVNGASASAVIPSASGTASGIVTTGGQAFAGRKTFNDTTDGTYSNDTAKGAVVIRGGMNVAKRVAAKEIRIDNEQSNAGCIMKFNTSLNCLQFTFV